MKRIKDLTKKDKIKYFVILSLLILLIIGTTYAYIKLTIKQKDINLVETGCFDVTMINQENAINLDNSFPLTDEQGRTLTPFTFTLKNNCDLKASYNVNLEVLSGSTLSSAYVATLVNNGTINTLGDLPKTDTTIKGSIESRTIYKGILAPGLSVDIGVSIWIDEDATISDNVENTTLKSKVVVVSTPTNIKTKTEEIIAQLDTTGKCPSVNEDGSVNVTAKEATNGYLCKAKDAYGDSYYYRGNVTNNYVKFGTWSNDAKDVVYGYYDESSHDFKEYSSLEECQNASSYNTNCTLISRAGKDMYWRIVRINGDGTIRVIYDGTSAHANGESSEDRQIGASAFNNNHVDNACVGYMYGATGASTYAAAHANTNDSTIKAYIDNWYKTNILGTANEEYLADNIFCNDRSISNDNTGTGAGTTRTNYRWYWGPWESGNHNDNMKLVCPQQNDAFTVSDTTKGNGALTYPIGLLSTDEIVLAGGWSTSNSGYYLYSGQYWWASSPFRFDGIDANVHDVISDGNVFYYSHVDNTFLVRPVFNLKAEVLNNGDGTASNPYRPIE